MGRDYAAWATITVKQEMRPTSQPNRGLHHTGMSGPLPMESPAHLDRNTQAHGVLARSAPYAGPGGPGTAFDRGREQMKVLAGLEVTAKSVERTAEAVGEDIAQREREEIDKAI